MDITERKITKIARDVEKLKASKAEIEASFYAYLTDTLTREEAAAFAVVLDKLYTVSKAESRASLEREGAGELMTKAISDVDDCVEGMRKFTTEIFDTGVALAGYAVMLFVYDWRLALLSLLFTPVSYICAAWMKKPVQAGGGRL